MKKKGNKKTPILRQEVIDNPIPTSLFISDVYPRRACTARVIVVECLCVCVCVRSLGTRFYAVRYFHAHAQNVCVWANSAINGEGLG